MTLGGSGAEEGEQRLSLFFNAQPADCPLWKCRILLSLHSLPLLSPPITL